MSNKKLKSLKRKKSLKHKKKSLKHKKKSLKHKRSDGGCDTWLQIPRDKYEDYGVDGPKKCTIHDQLIYPHLVHNPVIDIDYYCFVCGKEVCVRYLCRKCNHKK